MDRPFDQPTQQFSSERYFSGRKMFGGRFVLEKRIGRGGMGEVWRAMDRELGREVAMKFAPAEVANDPKSIAELRREVVAGLELSHPRIARVYDLQVGDGEAAISMELVDGKSLSDLQADTRHGFFEPEEIASWVEDVTSALEYAHTEAKRTHRDVKPKNILVDNKTGRAKLVDFGISKRLSDSLTRNTGRDSSGSLAYMSPQQMLGERTSPEDDWYSLGATVYELLTGAPPFFRGDVRTQIERVQPPPMTERREELVGEMIDGTGDPIPQDWETWVAKMLAKERGRMEDGAQVAVAAATPPPLPVQPAPAPAPVPEPAADPAPAPAMKRAKVQAAYQSTATAVEAPAENIEETGIWGDAPKQRKSVAKELRPVSGGRGLVWALLMVVFYGGGLVFADWVNTQLDGMDKELISAGWDLILFGCLTVGVWWFFRRHGRRGVMTAFLFLALGAVASIITGMGWNYSVDHPMHFDLLTNVNLFAGAVAVAVVLMMALGFGLRMWVPGLLLAGVAAGVAAVLVGYIGERVSEEIAALSWQIGSVFVGATFGIVSGISLVWSRKVVV